MTDATFEHLALLQMLERVQALEGDVQTLMISNARLSCRIDYLERRRRAECRGRLPKTEPPE